MDSTRSGLKWGVESAESKEGWTKANPADEAWVRAVSGLSGGVEGDMLRRNGSESSELLAGGLGRHQPAQRRRRI